MMKAIITNTKIKIPMAVKNIDQRKIIHNTVCNKEDMQQVILDFLIK